MNAAQHAELARIIYLIDQRASAVIGGHYFSHLAENEETYRVNTNADKRSFKHPELTRKVIGGFYEVYNELGHGFLESVYCKSLQIALTSLGISSLLKIDVPVTFRGKNVGTFEADVLVENCLFVEVKAVRALDKAHEAQLLNYLRATDIEVGLLLNFGVEPQFKRMAFDNSRKVVGKKCLQITDLLDRET